jgi:transcriptional activator
MATHTGKQGAHAASGQRHAAKEPPSPSSPRRSRPGGPGPGGSGPGRGNRRSRATRRRSALDVLAGLAALAALLVLLAGVPVALLTFFGLPVPHGVPSLSVLTHQISVSAVLKVCAVVVWLAWLQLVWCVVVEVAAAVRNTGMPARVPLAGGIQALAHRLVTSAMLLSATAAVVPALPAASAFAAAAPPAAAAAAMPGTAHLVGPGGTRPGHGPQAGPSTVSGQRLAGGPAAHGSGGSGGTVLEAMAIPLGPDGAQSPAAGALPGAQARPPRTGGAAAWTAQDTPEGAQAQHTEKIYVVKPPEGRFHESLWEIAQRHLGDGRRYREIFELNSGRIQPDGSKLTIASLIRPGWILVMPHDAHGPGIQTITVGPHQHPGGGQHGGSGGGQHGGQHGGGQHGGGQHSGGQHSGGQQGGGRQGGDRHQQPGGRHQGGQPGASQGDGSGHSGRTNGTTPHQSSPHELTPGTPATQPSPGAAGGGASAPGGSPTGPSHAAPRSARPVPPPPVVHGQNTALPFELAGAAFLAAGVAALLERKRIKQMGRRPFGQRIATPPPDAAWAEAALVLGEDAATAELVDAGLKYLARELTGQGRTPPTVFAAHVGEDNMDLWVAPAGEEPPAPWYAVGDGQVWRLPLAAVPELGSQEGAAPYPGLVTIGTDPTGRVLVDVASAHGLIAVTGPEDFVAESLAAVATELATVGWSEGIHLTLVGFEADLTALAPGRVRLAATLAEALPDLEAWAAEVADVSSLRDAGPRASQAEGMRAADWEPHYLISAIPPASAWERDRLLALARTGQAAGAGYLIMGEVPGATWTWEISQDGRLSAGALGLEVAAQHIPPEQEQALIDLVESTDDLVGAPLAAPDSLAPDEHLEPETQSPVEVTLLGPASVQTGGGIEPERLALATEIVVYLAVHPGGVHPNVLTAALWPRGVTPDVRDAALDRVAEWLGTDGIGRPHLAADATGRLRLGSGVRVDWHVFCTLVTLAAQAAAGHPTETNGAARPARGPDEAALLTQALDLVTGPFLAGRDRGRYSWLAVNHLEFEVMARVADAAHRLWELRLTGGDSHGAMAAARAGLKLVPHDELLWRDLLTAANATSKDHVLREVVAEIRARPTLDQLLPDMAPETEALIDELMPSWRWSVA